MKPLLHLFIYKAFLLFMCSSMFAQSTLSGFVYKANTSQPVYRARVTLLELGKEILTDRAGYYKILKIPKGIYTLRIENDAYQTVETPIVIEDRREKIEDIYLSYSPAQAIMGQIPIVNREATFSGREIYLQNPFQQNSIDVVDRMIANELAWYGFNRKGLTNQNQEILLNNIPTAGKIHTDDYSLWLSLQNITNKSVLSYPQDDIGEGRIGTLGGVFHINARPAYQEKGLQFIYGHTNNYFSNRYMLSYNTGISKKGWGIQAAGSRVSGNYWADQTKKDTWAYHIGIQKFIHRHEFDFSLTGVWDHKRLQEISTEEVYALQNHIYNPTWGIENNRIRNAADRYKYKPMLQIGYKYKWDSIKSFQANVYGRANYTRHNRLAYYKSNNPLPNDIRKLPSYLSFIDAPTTEIENLTNLWKTDVYTSQIDWNELIETNKTQSPTYALVADKENNYAGGLNIAYKNTDFEGGSLYLLINGEYEKSSFYAEIKDLLGASHFFNEDPLAPANGFYNIDNPSSLAEGDKYQYHYHLYNRQLLAMASYHKTVKNTQYQIGAQWLWGQIEREGEFKHYLFPTHSLGKSPLYNYASLISKFHITHTHKAIGKIGIQGTYIYESPGIKNLFPLVQYSSLTPTNLQYASRMFVHGMWEKESRAFQIQITPFFQYVWNDTMGEDSQYNADLSSPISRTIHTRNMISGVQTSHYGVEAFAQYKLWKEQISLQAYISLGQYTYQNKPILTSYSPAYGSNGEKYLGAINIKGMYLADTPQQVASFVIQYAHKNEWQIRLSANFLNKQYSKIDYYRYSNAFISDPSTNTIYDNIDPSITDKYLSQQKARESFFVNFSAIKSYDFNWFQLYFSLGVQNIFNHKNHITYQVQNPYLRNYNQLTGVKSQIFDDFFQISSGTRFYIQTSIQF